MVELLLLDFDFFELLDPAEVLGLVVAVVVGTVVPVVASKDCAAWSS